LSFVDFSGLGNGGDIWDDVIDFGGNGLGGYAAVFVGDGEDDVIVAIIREGMGGITTADNWSVVTKIPAIAEGIVNAWNCGFGLELDGLTFLDPIGFDNVGVGGESGGEDDVVDCDVGVFDSKTE
jgi:hypothetical protein